MNLRLQDPLAGVALCLLSLGLAGCGGSGSDMPELGQVTGTVHYDGLPLGGVTVVFFPEHGRPAMAETGIDGKYTLRYVRDILGCKVGKSRVEINFSEGADEEIESEGDEVAVMPDPSDEVVIQPRYNAESELVADVQPGNNVFDFDLKPE